MKSASLLLFAWSYPRLARQIKPVAYFSKPRHKMQWTSPCPFRRHVLKWAASFAAKLTALFSRNTKDLHHEDKFTTGLGLGQGPWPEVIGKEDKSCKFGEKCLPIFPGPCSPLDQIERASELSFLIAEMTVTNSLYIPTDANMYTY